MNRARLTRTFRAGKRARLAGTLGCLFGLSLAGCTAPLITAAHDGDLARVKELLASGANPNVDGAGYATLHFAALEGHAAVLVALIEAGADVNVANRGFTPLHYAAMKGRQEAVVVLLERGADVTRVAQDKTPRQWALAEGHHEIARLLAEVDASRAAGSQPAVAVVVPPLSLSKSLLVLPLRSEGGVGEHAPGVLTKLLLTELQAVRGVQTHSIDDLQAILSVEKQKDLLGCDSTTCMVEMAGALGTDLVLYGSLGKLGSAVSWSVSVLEPSTGRVAGRASVTVQGGDDVLATNARTLVADLVARLNDGFAKVR